MTWRELAAVGRWSGIYWPDLERDDQRVLLEMLRAAVPMTEFQNGMEMTERHKQPQEIDDPDLKAGAKILFFAELEAYVEGDPPIATVQWAETRAEAEEFLHTAKNEPEVTKGNPALSRCAHAERALGLLEALDVLAGAMGREIGGDHEDRAWLAEVIADAAQLGFAAGRHMQAAWGKAFETDALRGEKVREASMAGAEQRRNKLAPDTRTRLSAMARLMEEYPGFGVSWAAKTAAKHGYGKTEGANRALWYRYNPK